MTEVTTTTQVTDFAVLADPTLLRGGAYVGGTWVTEDELGVSMGSTSTWR